MAFSNTIGNSLQISGMPFKIPCRFAVDTYFNIFNGPLSIDSNLLNIGDRLLLINQNNPVQNGIYNVYYLSPTNSTLRPAQDFSYNGDIYSGINIYINSGKYANTIFTLTTPDPITQYSPLIFTPFISQGSSGTGSSGIAGSSGSSGINGSSGIGLSGSSGINGSSGSSGIDGSNGSSGIDGGIGSSGIDGSSGSSGIDGTSGSNGSSGIDGTSGTDGSSGVSFITLAYADAVTSSGAGSLLPGTTYNIYDAHPSLYGGTNVYIVAETPYSFGLVGTGEFYNPPYDNTVVGRLIWRDFSTYDPDTSNIFGQFIWGETVTGDAGSTGTLYGFISGLMVVNLGDGTNWSTDTFFTGDSSGSTCALNSFILHPGYSIGDLVIWGGYIWINTNGNIGSSIDDFTLNPDDWIIDDYNTDDYIVVYDDILYDFNNNLIIYRADALGNKVSASQTTTVDAIKYFQWGSGQVTF